MKYRLRCVTCGREVEAGPRALRMGALTCSECGALKGTLDVLYPLQELRERYSRDVTLLRGKPVFEAFFSIFPFAGLESLPPIRVGDTPLLPSPNLSSLIGVPRLWIKDDGRNPSASLKDRASAVALAMAREAGANVIAAASTGNAASSLATLAASVAAKAVVFVPSNAPLPKLTQILIHGARVVRLNSNYDTAFDLCQAACETFGWYNRNTAVNPFTGEGKKSVALEIVRDLGEIPDAVICPVGDGCIIGGVHKAFVDLRGLGLTTRLPRLYGVQAEGASPLVKAFETNSELEPLKDVSTVADSISVGTPRDGTKALRAVRDSGGAMVAVSDEEILDAQKKMATLGGMFAEPAASAPLAGLGRLIERNLVGRRESVVLLMTGHGLKDTQTALRNVTIEEELVEPDIDSVARKLGDLARSRS